MFNKLLDASIYFSFDKSGYLRHEKKFHHPLTFHKQDIVLITGGTSGIGLACAKKLLENSSVIVTGRSEQKAYEAKNIGAKYLQLDMADWDKIESAVDAMPVMTSVVLNAGGMPDKKSLNQYGVESQAASQFFGHLYLLDLLIKKDKLQKEAKVVWVTSGGMYLKNLDLNDLVNPKRYDKVAVYANVKRAQVTLLKSLQEKYQDYKLAAMHPGWVDTPAVKDSIPKCYDKTKHRLRTPLQGADTILWLLSDEVSHLNGDLFFDRKKVKKHFFFYTKKSDSFLKRLVSLVDDYQNKLMN